jgi:hypothetical protein
MPHLATMDSSPSDVWDSNRVRRPATSEVQTVLGRENRGSFEGHRTVLARAIAKDRVAWRSRRSDGRLRSRSRIRSASQRHFDLENTGSVIRAISLAMNALSTSSAARTSASAAGNRSLSVLAGASGIKTGNRVLSFTRRATCGRPKIAVAYQLPRRVDGAGVIASTEPGMRSRSFFVAQMEYTEQMYSCQFTSRDKERLRLPVHAHSGS